MFAKWSVREKRRSLALGDSLVVRLIESRRAGPGLPPKVVHERLGHASIVMTMDTYGHLSPRDDDGKALDLAAAALIG